MLSLPKQISHVAPKRCRESIARPPGEDGSDSKRNKEWDYTSPSAIKIYNMSKKQGSFGHATCKN